MDSHQHVTAEVAVGAPDAVAVAGVAARRPRAAPRPSGPLSGRRLPWRSRLAEALLACNRALERTPPGRWLRERLRLALEVTDVPVPVRSGRLPRPLEVVFLSDLHAGFYLGADELEDLAGRVAALSPDLICLGGDLVDSRAEEILLLDGFLRGLEAPLGVFAVPGNHEYYPARSMGAWRAYLEARGVVALSNEGRRVDLGDGDSLWIAGVDDLTESRPDLGAALHGRRPGEAALLLSHHPDLFVEAADHDVDLQLSGHTHGGQVRLLGWSPLRHSRFGLLRGLFREGRTHLYVGRGVGTTVAPLRIDARPEVALVRWGAG